MLLAVTQPIMLLFTTRYSVYIYVILHFPPESRYVSTGLSHMNQLDYETGYECKWLSCEEGSARGVEVMSLLSCVILTPWGAHYEPSSTSPQACWLNIFV